MKTNENNAQKTFGDVFFIVYKRQLTPKNTKKRQLTKI
jgi:hypothetical protein